MSLMKVFKESTELKLGAVVTAGLAATALFDGLIGQYGMCAAFALGTGLVGGLTLRKAKSMMDDATPKKPAP